MGFIAWIVFGALAGWVASMIMGRNEKMGLIANIIVGIIGAVLGGWLSSLLGFGSINGFNLHSFLIACGGACLLLFLTGMFRKR